MINYNFEEVLNESKMICDNEYIAEQALLEMGFNKKDLQDPKTVEKILKSKGFKTPLDFLNILVAILSAILSLASLGILLFPMVMLWTKVNNAVSNYPLNRQYKLMNKLQDKCNRLKEKATKELETTEDKSKLQDIIKNCNLVLKSIDDYYKKVKDNELMDNIEEAEGCIKDFINWYKKPYTLGDGGEDIILGIALLYGLSEQDIANKITSKESTCFYSGTNSIFGCEYKECVKDYPNISKIPEFEKGLEVVLVLQNDDYVLFYSKLAKKFFYTVGTEVKETTIAKESKNADISTVYKKYLIEADKRLGYYKLSKCPENITPKDFRK